MFVRWLLCWQWKGCFILKRLNNVSSVEPVLWRQYIAYPSCTVLKCFLGSGYLDRTPLWQLLSGSWHVWWTVCLRASQTSGRPNRLKQLGAGQGWVRGCVHWKDQDTRDKHPSQPHRYVPGKGLGKFQKWSKSGHWVIKYLQPELQYICTLSKMRRKTYFCTIFILDIIAWGTILSGKLSVSLHLIWHHSFTRIGHTCHITSWYQ